MNQHAPVSFCVVNIDLKACCHQSVPEPIEYYHTMFQNYILLSWIHIEQQRDSFRFPHTRQYILHRLHLYYRELSFHSNIF